MFTSCKHKFFLCTSGRYLNVKSTNVQLRVASDITSKTFPRTKICNSTCNVRTSKFIVLEIEVQLPRPNQNFPTPFRQLWV